METPPDPEVPQQTPVTEASSQTPEGQPKEEVKSEKRMLAIGRLKHNLVGLGVFNAKTDRKKKEDLGVIRKLPNDPKEY